MRGSQQSPGYRKADVGDRQAGFLYVFGYNAPRAIKELFEFKSGA